MQSLDVVGPFEVFATASLVLAGGGNPDVGYDVTLVSAGGEPVRTDSGLELAAHPLPAAGSVDTVLLPGGTGVEGARRDPELMAWIRRVSGTARRVVSVCTGATLAAEAGLLDGCRATTHWALRSGWPTSTRAWRWIPNRSSCAARSGCGRRRG